MPLLSYNDLAAAFFKIEYRTQNVEMGSGLKVPSEIGV